LFGQTLTLLLLPDDLRETKLEIERQINQEKVD
jgi:hypothetical protein